MIRFSSVSKCFHQHRPGELWALRDIDLHIDAGVTVFAGPSGSGKTTLLTLAGCLARPTSGRIHLDGRDISSLPERFLAELRRRTFGFVFQQFHLIGDLDALENVMLPAYPLGVDWRELRRRAAHLLDSLDLGHRAHARVRELSGGEQQRVAIARALINNPRVIIADEPTANLDSALAADFLDIVRRLTAEGRSVLLSSHDPLVIDSGIATRLVRLRDGRLVDEPTLPGGAA